MCNYERVNVFELLSVAININIVHFNRCVKRDANNVLKKEQCSRHIPIEVRNNNNYLKLIYYFSACFHCTHDVFLIFFVFFFFVCEFVIQGVLFGM